MQIGAPMMNGFSFGAAGFQIHRLPSHSIEDVVRSDSGDDISMRYAVPFVILANLALLIAIIMAIANKETVGLIECHETLLCILYFNTLLLAIKKYGAFGAFPIMLYMFLFFLLSNVIFDLFGLSSMHYSRVHLNYKISDETLITILVMYELFILAALIVVLFSAKRTTAGEMENNPTLERYATFAVLILGIPSICEYLLRMTSYVMSSAAYAESYIDDGSTSILSICTMLFRAVVPLYLASMPKGRFRKYCFILIVVFIVASMFGGSRSTGLIPLLFLIWYYVKTGHKVSIGKICIFLAVVFAIMTMVTSSRGSASSWNVVEQVNSDNVAFVMTANAIDYQDSLVNPRGNTFFLSGLLNPIMRYAVDHDAFTGGRNYDYAYASYSLDDKVMYAIAPGAFADGRGFGSSAVLEFYLFGGYIGVVVMTLLYLMGTDFFERKSQCSVPMFIFFYWWFQAIVFSPRGTPLPNFFYVALSLLAYFVITLLYRRMKGERLRRRTESGFKGDSTALI